MSPYKNLPQSILVIAACAAFVSLSNAALYQIHYTSGTSGIDAAFEGNNPTSFLKTYYNLPAINFDADGFGPNPASESNTLLPQIERAVGQIGRNNANGLYIPTDRNPGGGTGLPVSELNSNFPGESDGVVQALTNVSPTSTVSGGTLPSFTSLTSFNLPFIYSRTGTGTGSVAVTYTVGTGTPRVWTSAGGSYLDEINGIELRLRGNTNGTSNFAITNLEYTDEITPLTSVSQFNTDSDTNEVSIRLIGGIVGDFTMTGNYVFSVDDPGTANGWNHQIKGLALPIPEPSTFALLSASVVLALRRRR